jgi:hypothetical protein
MITEKNFLPFFQKDISIVLENKILRQGILLLCSIKDFYLHFTILNNGVTKCFELPYPFETYMESVSTNVLILDYKFESFTQDLSDISEKAIALYNKDKHMKFFDNVVKIIETV